MTMSINEELNTFNINICIYLALFKVIKQLLPSRDPQSDRAAELTATVKILYCGKICDNVLSKLIAQNHQEMSMNFTFKTNK